MPSLDSINVHTSHKNIHTIEYVTRTIKTPQKLITTSPSITAGYDPINKQWGIMVGVSVNFNIWK
jgi:hypothetical protein